MPWVVNEIEYQFDPSQVKSPPPRFKRTKMERAVEIIDSIVPRDGRKVPHDTIEKAFEGIDIKKTTIFRARESLGIEIDQEYVGAKVYWYRKLDRQEAA
jgi:hypothetical protein